MATEVVGHEVEARRELAIELAPHVRRMAQKTWDASRKTARIGRTVVLKLKTGDFQVLTRSLTPSSPPRQAEEFVALALSLLDRVNRPEQERYRLVGIGLGNFSEPDDPRLQPDLFAS